MDSIGTKAPGRRKVILTIIISVAVIALAIGAYLLISLQNYKKDVAAIEIRNVDMATVEDGEYFGSSDVGFVSAKVRVLVENHVLIEIELLEHNNGRGAAAEVLPDEMIKEQRVDLDTITGATSSSKVIMEAVYNALTG